MVTKKAISLHKFEDITVFLYTHAAFQVHKQSISLNLGVSHCTVQLCLFYYYKLFHHNNHLLTFHVEYDNSMTTEANGGSPRYNTDTLFHKQ